MRKKIPLMVGAIAVAILMTGCSEHFTDPSMMAVRYSGGLGEGGKFKECVKPGEKQVSDDSYYPYPTTQRQDLWDTGNKAADHSDLELASKDGVVVHLRINVNFGLNTDCDTLRTFHETIGNTRKAYFHDDGTYGQGWIDTMNYYVSPAVVSRARSVVSQYKISELWPSTANLTKIQEDIQGDPETAASLQGQVDNLTEGDDQFYNRLTVNLYSVDPDEGYKSQFLERQQASTAADTAELNKQAQVKQANAEKAVKIAQAQADAAAKRQAILAYKLPGMSMASAVRAYNEAQAIEKGINPWQPTGMGYINNNNQQ